MVVECVMKAPIHPELMEIWPSWFLWPE